MLLHKTSFVPFKHPKSIGIFLLNEIELQPNWEWKHLLKTVECPLGEVSTFFSVK